MYKTRFLRVVCNVYKTRYPIEWFVMCIKQDFLEWFVICIKKEKESDNLSKGYKSLPQTLIPRSIAIQ